MPSASGAAPAPPPRLYVALDDGTLLVLLRHGAPGDEEEARGSSRPAGPSHAPPPSTHLPGAVVSGTAAASLVGDVAPGWRVMAAYTHVARKGGVQQMQVRE